MSNPNPNDGLREVEPDRIEEPPPYREGQRQVLTPDTGRQGPSGTRALVVLAVSLAALMALWAIGWGLNLF